MRTRLMSYIPSLRLGKIGGASGMPSKNLRFCLAFRSACTIVPLLRSGKIGGASGMTKQKSAFLLVIPLGLHYLCKHE